MKILYANLFGLGNCIMGTPCVEALRLIAQRVDVLVDATRGSQFAFLGWSQVHALRHYDRIPLDPTPYDCVVWGHPRKPIFTTAPRKEEWIDPNPTSARPYHLRFDRHEVVEQVAIAERLGYSGPVPPLREPFHIQAELPPPRAVAIGIGYLKNGRWADKHWGNTNYIELCRILMRRGFTPVLVGDIQDHDADGRQIARESGARSICGQLPLPAVLGFIRGCRAFVGNDTGLMHAAAAFGLPTVALFRVTDPLKNGPWGKKCLAMIADVSPPAVAHQLAGLTSTPCPG